MKHVITPALIRGLSAVPERGTPKWTRPPSPPAPLPPFARTLSNALTFPPSSTYFCAQHWQSMEQAGDWARLFKSGSQDISPDSEESVPVWVLIARPIPRSSKLTVTKTLYSLKQKEYCEAFRRWKKEQEVVYRLELKKAQEQEVEYKLRQELAEQSTVAGKAGAVEPITLLPPPMPPPPPTFKPSPQDFFLVPPSSRCGLQLRQADRECAKKKCRN